MSAHSPQIALAAAERRRYVAAEECPHWDEMTPDGDDYACCRELQDARMAVRAAKRAAQAEGRR